MRGTEARAYVDIWRVTRTRPVLLQQVPSGISGGGSRRPTTQEARLAIFAEAAEILANESSSSLRIDDVARRVATSPRQLQRVFADVAGVGFRSYLRRLRMSKAAGLLAGGSVPVKEIAHAVGYQDPGQFSKAFKRTYGLSPSQFRARARGGAEQSGRVAPSPSS